jgi:hypothetical protein
MKFTIWQIIAAHTGHGIDLSRAETGEHSG